MASELKDYKEKVYAIMEKYEQARNNDWTLIAHYVNTYRYHLLFENEAKDKCVALKDLKKFPSAETIIRARRLIQNEDGVLLPTDPAVSKKRRIKEQNYRDAEVREAKAHEVNPQYPH